VKISNETKVGVLAIIAITLLILGFNYLKGRKLFSDDMTLYGKYESISGLTPSNPVMINGLQVGSVSKISNDEYMQEIIVSLNITKDIKIPTNSVALIVPNPLSTPRVEIKLGDATTFFKTKDSIATDANKGILDDVLSKVDPVLFEVKKAVTSLDTLIRTVNAVVDSKAKDNIGHTLENLNRISASMLVSTSSLEQLLNQQTGSLAKTLNNLSAVTGNLANNNDKINNVMSNLDKTTGKFAQLDFQKTLNTIDSTINQLQTMVSKFSNNNGTLGLMLNDPSLYKNLASTSNKLNLLLDDIRINPKRYVSISVFGKKQTAEALKVPQPDTLNSPYIIKKAD
jgi:phospholipid/cholesterol/gamma-HCH transport system substrate-binding protein